MTVVKSTITIMENVEILWKLVIDNYQNLVIISSYLRDIAKNTYYSIRTYRAG